MVILLGLDIVVAWMVIQGAYLYLGMTWHALAGEFLPRGTLDAHGRQFLALRRIQATAWVATLALFLAWLHQARRGARPGGVSWPGARRELITAILVPGLNLVRPVRSVSALWHASAPRPATPVSGIPPWIGWWWGLVLAAALGHLTVAILAADRSRALDLGGPMQLLLLTEVAEIGAAVLAILVVRRIADRQDDARRSRER